MLKTKERAFSFGALIQKTRDYFKYPNNPGPSMDEIAGVWDEENDNPTGHPWEGDNEKN